MPHPVNLWIHVAALKSLDVKRDKSADLSRDTAIGVQRARKIHHEKIDFSMTQMNLMLGLCSERQLIL